MSICVAVESSLLSREVWDRWGWGVVAGLVAMLIGAGSAQAAKPRSTKTEANVKVPAQSLDTLRREHPRLHLTAERLDLVRKVVKEDPVAAKVYAVIEKSAQKSMAKEPCKYEKPDGRRLLPISRDVLRRITEWGFLYRLTGEPKYADRAWKELSAVAEFPDWNPAHFLDTAEMTYAFALGYDWFYDRWTDEQRARLRKAILEMGLQPALRAYEPQLRSWAKVTNNWNQVCNGGIALGALAVAEDEPKLAAKIVSMAVALIPNAVRVYQPDGAGTEGVTYWHYATQYNTALLDALQTSLGTCLGLDKVDGYAQSADFQLYFSGASYGSFDFGDCGNTLLSSPQHFWFGRHYNTPRHSWFRYTVLSTRPDRGRVEDLLWYDPSARGMDPREFPLDKRFRGAELAVMRSAWDDPNALVLGIEGAPASDYNHRHLDSGSFILEANGVRWIVDCGTEHETYMSHTHKHKRWEYYRTRAEGHNTLLFNPSLDPDQTPSTPAPITRFESKPERCLAEMDLSKAYADHARKVTRRYEMIDRNRVRISDRIEGAKAADLWSFLHTMAQVEVAPDGRRATLSQGGKKMEVLLVEPTKAQFELRAAEPLPTSPKVDKQVSNSKIRKLAIHLQDIRNTTLVVELIPVP